MSSKVKKAEGAQEFTPVFVDVKQELEENDVDYEMTERLDVQNKGESRQHKYDPLSNIKVEHDPDVPNSASTSTSMTTTATYTKWTAPIKQEFVSDQDISMDMEYEAQEWAEHDVNSDGDSSSISISDNLDNIKQETSSEESSEESSEDDIADVDDNEDGEDEREEDEEDDSEDSEDDSSIDPLRRCLNILKKRPNTILDFPEIAILLLILIRRRRRNQPNLKRRRWAISENSDRIARVNFQRKFTERRQNHKQFLMDFNMSVKTFDELLAKISHRIKRKDTNMRYAITPAERLAVTLRYLASGFSYTQLLDEFDIGKTTISGIVKTTTEIIWQELRKEYMPQPTKEEWLKIADKFYEKTKFPNCLGSICSKYVKVLVPKSKESEFDRHQKYFATAILAIVDSDMSFIDISVGVLGNSNDNFLVKSTIGRKITKKLYDIPESKLLPGSTTPLIPYVFVSKDSLNTNIMKAFSKTTDEKKLIFNRRLEKAHAISETCLRIVANKWRVFRRGIGHHSYAEPTIKTICILHNFILKKEGMKIDEVESWVLDGVPSCGMRGTTSANLVRDYFAGYFVSSQGSVPWQYVTPQSKSDEMTENKTETELPSENIETDLWDPKKLETNNGNMEADVIVNEIKMPSEILSADLKGEEQDKFDTTAETETMQDNED